MIAAYPSLCLSVLIILSGASLSDMKEPQPWTIYDTDAWNVYSGDGFSYEACQIGWGDWVKAYVLDGHLIKTAHAGLDFEDPDPGQTNVVSPNANEHNECV